ncbi:MAG: 2TM domain-containing protein [Desulfobulbaceae bacterium]|nr:2TM domain-containing protein [Candidatus Kapabacteria bacterium]MBS3999181.1 2TM domain-containing protein [Desulfobulbaceae bacterium]
MSEKLYSKEEVDRILRRAIDASPSYSGSVTEAELLRIANELNIDPSQVRKAMNEDIAVNEFESAKSVWLKRKRSSFYEHLTAYVIVNSFLVGIDYMTPGISWSIFPILGWGIGLAFDFVDSFFPSEEKVEKGARKLMNSKKWKNILDSIIDAFNR